MTNSFDSKVYDFIKTDEQTERLSFDDIYPVNSIARRSNKTPPSQGTWELIGVYGTISNVSIRNVEHRMIFNGKLVIDNILQPSQNSDPDIATIKFDDYIGEGNYTLIRSFDSFAGNTLSSMCFNCYDTATGDDHNKFIVYTHYSDHDYAALTKLNCDDDCQFQSTLLLEIKDLSSVPEGNLVFEYKRTN